MFLKNERRAPHPCPHPLSLHASTVHTVSVLTGIKYMPCRPPDAAGSTHAALDGTPAAMRPPPQRG